MERAEYKGKTYEKVKSLAPVEVLKEIKTECEKNNFTDYLHWVGYGNFYSEPNFSLFMCNFVTPKFRLPWLLSHGFIREVKDEREEHLNKWREHWQSTSFTERKVWDWFDQNPIPKKEK